MDFLREVGGGGNAPCDLDRIKNIVRHSAVGGGAPLSATLVTRSITLASGNSSIFLLEKLHCVSRATVVAHSAHSARVFRLDYHKERDRRVKTDKKGVAPPIAIENTTGCAAKHFIVAASAALRPTHPSKGTLHAAYWGSLLAIVCLVLVSLDWCCVRLLHALRSLPSGKSYADFLSLSLPFPTKAWGSFRGYFGLGQPISNQVANGRQVRRILKGVASPCASI